MLEFELITTATSRTKTFNLLTDEQRELLLSQAALLCCSTEISALMAELASMAEMEEQLELLRAHARAINTSHQCRLTLAGVEEDTALVLQAA